MEVGSPEWIEASLAKLEQLEQERATHQQAIETVKEPLALRRHTEALGRLDAEIKTLYAQLEAFAEDDEEESSEQDEDELAAVSAAPERRTVDDESLSAPHTAAKEPPSAPIPMAPAVISSAASSDAPFSSAPTPVAMSAPAPSYDLDDEPKGGAGKWIFLGVLLVGGLAAGGFFMMQGNKEPAAQPTEKSGSEEVIKAADVPDDTEAPKAAKGADVDRTPLENQGGPSGTSGGSTKKKNNDKGDGKKVIKLGDGEDPLG